MIQMTKTFAVYCGVAIATLVGHYTLNTQRHMTNMEFLLKASDTKERIQNDQIGELISGLQLANQKNESLRTEGYLAGVADVINKPDHYMAIWHQGYDRGSAVQADAMNVSMRLKPVPENLPTPIAEEEKNFPATTLTEEGEIVPPKNK